MGTITLPNFRTTADVTMRTRLKDGGVSIDWADLTNIKAWLYSDAQKAIAGRCDVRVDADDSTKLICEYAATKSQYLGVNRLIVQARYNGSLKTYDRPVFNFVPRTAEATGNVTIDEPEIDVEIVVQDVSSSILDSILAACIKATEEAQAMIDMHQGIPGKSPYIGENGHWYEWDEETHQYVDTETNATGETPDITIGTVTTAEPGTPASASMTGTPEQPILNLSIPKGAVGSTPNITVGTVTTGQPGTPVVVTITGTPEAPVLNIQIPQGLKGDTGVSADYPITVHNGLDSDATDEALAAAQGKFLKGEIDRLGAETTDFKGVENRKLGKDVTYGEAKVTPTWTDGYQISKTDGSLLESASMAYTVIAIGAAKYVRFLGPKFKTPSSWNGGYAFYDENDECLAAYAFDAADDNANGTKEYIVGVPSGAVTFKTSVYTGDSYPIATKDNFYCFLINGATVSDLLEGITQINRSAVNLSSISAVYYYINSSGNWTNNGYHRSLTVPVFPGQRYRITANNDYPTVYAFLTSTAREGGSAAPLVSGTTIVTVPKMATVEIVIPPTCFYINFRGCTSQAELNISARLRCPSSFVQYNELLSVVTELETKRANLLVPMVGNAQTIVYSPHIKSIVGGYGYRLHLMNPDVSMTGVSSNEYTLSVYFDAGDTIRLQTSNSAFKDTYDFLVPSGAKEMYLGIRCAKGATFDVMVEQLGENGGGDITALNPESEFVPKFMSAKKRYYTSSDTDEPTPLVLLHLSDIHGNWANVERFIKFADKYTSYIDVLINTGDTVADKLDDGTSGYAEIDGVEKVLNVIGNHDSSKYEGGVRDWQYYCGLPCYEVFVAPFVSDWGVTQPENAAANGYCYYYKDFSAKKIRLVIVDIMSYDATQDAWLDSVLDDALSNGYHVLIATHFAGSTAPGHGDDAAFTKVPCNYTSLYSLGGSSSLLNSYNVNGYLMMATVQNFIDGGGHFAGYIQGHYHADFVAKVADYPDQMIYAIGSSRSGELRDYKHTIGTRMQDEFQIVSVDTKNTIVKLYKVGANVDRYGRTKNSVCVNYTTGEILGEGF